MTDTEATTATLGRRGFLKGAAGGVAAAAGVTAAAPASAAPPTFGGWMSDANNYGKVVDARGESSVTIEVGVEASNGPYAFGPAAVRVDPGTEVVWKWTGKGSHNVVAKGGGFESKLTAKKGFTFSRKLETTGVVKYSCSPHKTMGMKGVVVVGDAMPGGSSGGSSSDGGGGKSSAAIDYGGWFDGVSNFDGTADATGKDEVTVEVGVEANGGPYGFGPPAVKVTPGTTVVWKWTGKGSHNVVAKGGGFESKLTDEKGFTFEHTFEEPGVYKYYCSPHEPMGMKGAVAVVESGSKSQSSSGGGGNAGSLGGASGAASTGELLLGGSVVAALLGAVGVGAVRSDGE